jgi:hypothetical protein
VINIQVVYELTKLGISFLENGQQCLELGARHVNPKSGENLRDDAPWHHPISLHIQGA